MNLQLQSFPRTWYPRVVVPQPMWHVDGLTNDGLRDDHQGIVRETKCVSRASRQQDDHGTLVAVSSLPSRLVHYLLGTSVHHMINLCSARRSEHSRKKHCEHICHAQVDDQQLPSQ